MNAQTKYILIALGVLGAGAGVFFFWGGANAHVAQCTNAAKETHPRPVQTSGKNGTTRDTKEPSHAKRKAEQAPSEHPGSKRQSAP